MAIPFNNMAYMAPSPRAGAYICHICNVIDYPNKEYLLLKLDIAEGPCANFAKQREAAYGNDWSYIKAYQSYRSGARYHLDKFFKLLEESNHGTFTLSNHEQELEPEELVGLKIGIVLGIKQYKNKYGKLSTKPFVDHFVSVDDINYGNLEIPAPKELEV